MIKRQESRLEFYRFLGPLNRLSTVMFSETPCIIKLNKSRLLTVLMRNISHNCFKLQNLHRIFKRRHSFHFLPVMNQYIGGFIKKTSLRTQRCPGVTDNPATMRDIVQFFRQPQL